MSLTKYLLAAAIAGAAAPAVAAPDNYTIDPAHTYPSIEFSHMGLSVWRGKFNKTSGKVVLDRAARSGTVEVSIDVSSINFCLAAMDEKARSDDFFDTDKFPTATYKGKINFAGDKPKTVDGQITIRGVRDRRRSTSSSSIACRIPCSRKRFAARMRRVKSTGRSTA